MSLPWRDLWRTESCMIPVAPGQQGQPWAVPSQPVRPEPTEESLLPMVHRGHGHSQQPQGAEALKGQWRDALQGVVAEDPVQRKEATQRGHPELHAAPPPPHVLPPHQLRAQLHSGGRSPGLWGPLGTPSLRQGSLQPSARTYRVVSWLMLVKEELLSELILLLLRSLQNTDPAAVASPVPSRCTSSGAQGHTASQP